MTPTVTIVSKNAFAAQLVYLNYFNMGYDLVKSTEKKKYYFFGEITYTLEMAAGVKYYENKIEKAIKEERYEDVVIFKNKIAQLCKK